MAEAWEALAEQRETILEHKLRPRCSTDARFGETQTLSWLLSKARSRPSALAARAHRSGDCCGKTKPRVDVSRRAREAANDISTILSRARRSAEAGAAILGRGLRPCGSYCRLRQKERREKAS
jgi:hypothetical protein